jgi:hypothetical protein
MTLFNRTLTLGQVLKRIFQSATAQKSDTNATLINADFAGLNCYNDSSCV